MSRLTKNTLAAALTATLLLGGCAGGINDGDHNVGSGGNGNDYDDSWDKPQNGGSNNGGTKTPNLPKCKPKTAPALFKNALCVCGDLKDVGALLVREGPDKETPSMGVNGVMKVINHSGIDGSLVAYKGLEAIANIDVRDHLKSVGHVNFTGRLKVGRDLLVGGNLFGMGVLDVGGKMGVAGSSNVLGGKNVKQQGGYTSVGPAPCGCGPGQVVDVKAEVSKARNNNNNSKAGLPGAPMATIGKNALVLNTGRYYFGNKKSIGYTNIKVNGAVSIYVDGDLDSIGYDRFKITNGSVLSLYVAGNVNTIGHMLYGEKHHPGAFRLYIGGSKKATMQIGNQVFRGAVYAPKASVHWVGRTKVEGSLLVGTLISTGLLELYFSRPAHDKDGNRCNPPGGSGKPKKDKDPPDPKDLPLVK